MRRLALVVVAGVLALSAPGTVLAHSLLLESSPAAEAAVPPPARVTLRFNNRIEKKLSQLRVVPPQGEAQNLAVALDGPANELAAPFPPLGPGHYRIEWRVLSIDGHVVNGRFAFRISP